MIPHGISAWAGFMGREQIAMVRAVELLRSAQNLDISSQIANWWSVHLDAGAALAAS